MPIRFTLRLLVFLLVGVTLGGCGNSSVEKIDVGADGRLVDIGPCQLHVTCRGDGPPTVVIDVGLGESYQSWQPIIEDLSNLAAVCTYDRAGYGESEPGPFPRTAGQCEEELRALLGRISAEPPYVLVGHSLGALHCMLLAAREPQGVAGLVLLDPPPRDFLNGQRFLNLRDLADAETTRMRQGAEQARRDGNEGQSIFLETVASEHESMFRESAEQIETIGDFGDLPLIVLASGVPNPNFGDSAIAFQDFWLQSSRSLAGMSRGGECLLAAESGHHIYRDDPQLTFEAIELMVNLARREIHD